jgi:acyl-homoserine-lactone acylase
MRRWSALVLACAAWAADPRAEILWDRWGVPHIFAKDHAALFYAYGRAQMHNHANLLLRLYGEARGRGAEYWGRDFLAADQWLWTLGAPERGAEWYRRQPADFRKLIDAFAAGLNDYAREHPDEIAPSVRQVLPVDGADVMRHAQRVVHLGIVGPASLRARVEREWESGSNGWAVAPAKSASGKAMLLINPHLEWGGPTTYMEAHLVAPGVNVSGAAQVGIPVIRLGFNDRLGWMTTVNPIDNTDLYELELTGAGYRWGGGSRKLEERTVPLKVRQADGSLKDEPLRVRRSVHGPLIVERKGKAVAMRMAGLDQPWMLHQYWMMAQAVNLAQFEKQLARLQIPAYNVIYADRDGHILHLFNGRVPKRPAGDYRWDWIVPGTSKRTLWTRTHGYAELPKLVDPPSGWLQNANDPPWVNTLPPSLDPARFPAYVAPRFFQFRAQSSLRLLGEAGKLTLEEFMARKHSTAVEMAGRVLPDLIAAAKPSQPEAAAVLEKWDRTVKADSRGAVLFEAFTRHWSRNGEAMRFEPGETRYYRVPWDPREPLRGPEGLANPGEAVKALASAAQEVRTNFGRLDPAWGEAFRLRAGGADLAASGGPGPLGVFRTFGFRALGNGRYAARHGDSYVAVVEFGDPVRAFALLSYGNASQSGSRHISDQVELLAKNQLRPALRSRAEIEKQAEAVHRIP